MINKSHPSRSSKNVPLSIAKHNFFRNNFFHQSLRNGIDLTQTFEAQTVLLYLQKNLLNFISPLPSKVPIPRNPQGFKLFTILGLGRSHLRDYKFKHLIRYHQPPL